MSNTPGTLCPSCQQLTAIYDPSAHTLTCTDCKHVEPVTLVLAMTLWDAAIDMNNKEFAKCEAIEREQGCDENAWVAALGDDVKLQVIEAQQKAIRAKYMTTESIFDVQQVVLIATIEKYIQDLAKSPDVTPESRKQVLSLIKTANPQMLVTWARKVLSRA